MVLVDKEDDFIVIVMGVVFMDLCISCFFMVVGEDMGGGMEEE